MHDLHSILLKILECYQQGNEVGINLKLLINLRLHVIILPLSHYFLIVTEKLTCFSILSPIHLISPLNSIAN